MPPPNLPHHEMIPVEGGTFIMGDDNSPYDDEKPAHPVTVSAFSIGQYPVTQALWEAVMGNNPSYFQGKDRPVEQVSWYDAAVFCNVLNEVSGYEPCYYADEGYQEIYGKTDEGYVLPNEGEVYRKVSAGGYRLPTEAEWEYAARGGQKGEGYLYAGGEKLDEVGWYDDNSHRETKPVGLKLDNELGLYDMSGNVWEWCEDQWHASYDGAPDDGSAWVDREQGADRVFRGGSWATTPAAAAPLTAAAGTRSSASSIGVFGWCCFSLQFSGGAGHPVSKEKSDGRLPKGARQAERSRRGWATARSGLVVGRYDGTAVRRYGGTAVRRYEGTVVRRWGGTTVG